MKKATEAAQKSNRTNIPRGADRDRGPANTNNRGIDVRSTVKNLSDRIPDAKAKDLNSLRRDLRKDPGDAKSRINEFTRDMRKQDNITGKQSRDISRDIRNLPKFDGKRPSYLDQRRIDQVQRNLQNNIPRNIPGIGSNNRGNQIPRTNQSRRPNVTTGDINRIINQFKGRGNLPGINRNVRIPRPTVAQRRDVLSTRLKRNIALGITAIAVNSAVPNANVQFNNWRRLDRRYDRYYSRWHRGFWPTSRYAYRYPNRRWNYWQRRYPVVASFGLSPWAVNRAGYAFGYYGYNNPYCYAPSYVNYGGYDYTQPIVVENYSSSSQYADAPVDSQNDQAMAAFNYAQQQFYNGDYDGALESINEALKDLPNDAVLHEFRALVLFALGDYQTAAATLYPVLSVGPGWNWSTMNSLYPDVAVYTQHLRALEDYRTANPNDAAARFVLSYQYITCGHTEAAIKQLKKLLEIAPDDRLAAQLLTGLDENTEIPDETPKFVPPEVEKTIDTRPLIGSWKATRGEDKFAMTLKDDGKFDWSFTRNDKVQNVTGVWSMNEKGILAMEMDDETVMLSQIVLNESGGLDFYMLGDTQEEEPLKFQKAPKLVPVVPPAP